MKPTVLPDQLLRCMEASERKKLGKAGVTASEAAEKCAHRNEAEMQAQIQAFCDLKGWPCFRSRTDRKTTMPVGTPDFLICLPVWTRCVNGTEWLDGQFVAIETKMRGNDTTPEQKLKLAQIKAAGGETYVAYSAADAIAFLKQLAGETTP